MLFKTIKCVMYNRLYGFVIKMRPKTRNELQAAQSAEYTISEIVNSISNSF